MDNDQNGYHVSFFKPVTNKARRNRNMVIWLVLIWATAVFGFQILLRVVEKPVAEPAYDSFISVWDDVSSGTAGDDELNVFANSVVTLLGKVYIKPDYKEALSNGFTWSVFKIAGEESESLGKLLAEFEDVQESSENILDAEYISIKKALEKMVADMLGIGENDPKRVVIPFVLQTAFIDNYSDENMSTTAEAMSLYMIHNRSFLTDARFLGFPFHYFYTAVFLLILFIGLCWAYCVITDRRDMKQQAS